MLTAPGLFFADSFNVALEKRPNLYQIYINKVENTEKNIVFY